MLALLLMILAGICYSCSRQKESRDVLNDSEVTSGLPGEEGEAEFSFGEEKEKPEKTEASQQTGEEPAVCFVHICGAVKEPGVYELSEGSRVYQAVRMAGGFLAEADESFLNLAAVIEDGMKITVLTKEEAEKARESNTVPFPGDIEGPKEGKVNINTAGRDELMTLKGIGESRADEIIAYRKSRGRFEKIEDIMQVPGIKDGAFQKIKDDITV